MKVRRIILEEDYTVLKTWWERRGTEAPQMALLPYTGVVAESDGKMISCAFLYEDKGSTIAMIEWEATNPDCTSAMQALRALNMVFDFFETYCEEQGIPVILSWVEKGRGDGRLLERRQWKKCPGERHELMAFATRKEEVCLP